MAWEEGASGSGTTSWDLVGRLRPLVRVAGPATFGSAIASDIFFAGRAGRALGVGVAASQTLTGFRRSLTSCSDGLDAPDVASTGIRVSK